MIYSQCLTKSTFFQNQLNERLAHFELRCAQQSPQSGLLDIESFFPILVTGTFELTCTGQSPEAALVEIQRSGHWPLPLLCLEQYENLEPGRHVIHKVRSVEQMDDMMFEFVLDVQFSYSQVVRAVTPMQALESAYQTVYLPEDARGFNYACALIEEIQDDRLMA